MPQLINDAESIYSLTVKSLLHTFHVQEKKKLNLCSLIKNRDKAHINFAVFILYFPFMLLVRMIT